MDQELRLEQKNQQLSTILTIISEFVNHEQLGQIFVKIDSTFPEMDFYNCNSFKQSFPHIKTSKGQGKNAKGKKAGDKRGPSQISI